MKLTEIDELIQCAVIEAIVENRWVCFLIRY